MLYNKSSRRLKMVELMSTFGTCTDLAGLSKIYNIFSKMRTWNAEHSVFRYYKYKISRIALCVSKRDSNNNLCVLKRDLNNNLWVSKSISKNTVKIPIEPVKIALCSSKWALKMALCVSNNPSNKSLCVSKRLSKMSLYPSMS